MSEQTQREGDSAGPHKFSPLKPWDMRSGGRCRHCYAPMSAHPVHAWIKARPLGDKRKAELSFEMLHAPDAPKGNVARPRKLR